MSDAPANIETDRDPEPDPVGRDVAPPRPIARYVSIGVGVFLIGFVALLGFAPSDDPDEATSLLGGRTPLVEGPTLAGGAYDIDEHRGEWVLVNFFATWCAGCVNEHPDLVELERWGAERGDVGIVSVVFNDPVDSVERFFASEGGAWPVLNNPSIPVQFQVAQIPETFLVAPNGQVVAHIQGEVGAADIMAEIDRLEG